MYAPTREEIQVMAVLLAIGAVILFLILTRNRKGKS
jgi:hypothetical protein